MAVPHAARDGPLPPELLDRLRSVDTPTLSNAIEQLGVRDRLTGFSGDRVRCMFPEFGPVVGYAVTAHKDITTPGPRTEALTTRHFNEFLAEAPAPAVIVVQDVGSRPGQAASTGELASKLAMRLGAVAYMTDGAVRDAEEVRALGFHYFASGMSASHGIIRYRQIGAPALIDGLLVHNGDLIHADVNGIITIPLEVAEQLPAEIDKVRVDEREIMDAIDSPDFSLESALTRMGF